MKFDLNQSPSHNHEAVKNPIEEDNIVDGENKKKAPFAGDDLKIKQEEDLPTINESGEVKEEVSHTFGETQDEKGKITSKYEEEKAVDEDTISAEDDSEFAKEEVLSKEIDKSANIKEKKVEKVNTDSSTGKGMKHQNNCHEQAIRLQLLENEKARIKGWNNLSNGSQD